jgi:hypothetical protein
MDLADQYNTETEVWESRRGCPIALADLKHLADEHRDSYRAALPWPHLVLNDLVDPGAVRDAEAQELEQALGLELQNGHRIVKAESPQVRGEAARDILNALRTPEFVEFLERLTGVTALVPRIPRTIGRVFMSVHQERFKPSTGISGCIRRLGTFTESMCSFT